MQQGAYPARASQGELPLASGRLAGRPREAARAKARWRGAARTPAACRAIQAAKQARSTERQHLVVAASTKGLLLQQGQLVTQAGGLLELEVARMLEHLAL